MPPYATSKLTVSISASPEIQGVAIAQTASGKTITLSKVSDIVLEMVRSTRGTIRSIIFSSDYAESLLLSGGAGALSVNRKVQELVHEALIKTFPGKISGKLAAAYDD